MSQTMSPSSDAAEGEDATLDRRWSGGGVDHSPARNVWWYTWLMAGWRQLVLAGLALAAAAANLAPIELQRRMIDDAIAPGDVDLLVRLGVVYAVALLAHQALKLALAWGQAAVGERTAAYTRRHLLFLRDHGDAEARERRGEAVSIMSGEVDKLAGFVGAGPSGAVRDLATLAGVVGYMMWTAPSVALVALGLIAPQAVLAPVVQSRLNRLVERRLSLVRAFGDSIVDGDEDETGQRGRIVAILRNRMAFARLKAILKGALNLLNGAAPLAILLFGGWLAINGETTLGVVVAFVSGLERIAAPIRGLIGFYRLAAQADVQHDMIARRMERSRKG